MKLKDLLEEPADEAKEFKAWILKQQFNRNDKKTPMAKWDESKVIAVGQASWGDPTIRLQPKKNITFSMPDFVKPENWSSFYEVHLIDYELKDFSNVPQPQKSLEIIASKIDSLKGIEAQKCEKIYLSMDRDEDHTNKIGLLRLLKIQSLKELILMDDVGHAPPAYKELNIIIMKHLKGDRNIAECQQELIEAGFEEYAKL